MKQLLLIFGILFVFVGIRYVINITVFVPVEKPNYGVSFSPKFANELGIDSQAAFAALVDDLGIKKLRLMSYWDLHEPVAGNYQFDNLDWQFREAEKLGAKISLAIGLRQPRWPECHQPGWAAKLPIAERNQQLENYIRVVVERYKDSQALESWQLENEAMNRQFGECEPPDRSRLIREYSLVKQLDSQHPIIMNLSDQHGLALGKPIPDVYGFSVYRIFYNWVVYKNYITYPTPVWYHRLRAFVIEAIHKRPIIIHELQAEPWGPRPTVELSVAEQNKSMSTEQLAKNLDFAKHTGIHEQYLWGGEWWYWRLTQGDPTIWNTVKERVN